MLNFTLLKRLNANGVLGINKRNIDYISRYNNRKYYSLVDDKLKTKELCSLYNLPTPRLIEIISMQHQIKYPTRWIEVKKGFAIKPANGSGGKGILIVQQHDQHNFTKPSGEVLTLTDVQHHLSNVLAGLFSLGGASDNVIVEELIEMDDVFLNYSYEGIPDIRIIVFQGFPIMAMLRLSTHASDGKANLHQGALGVGINIATGQCSSAIYNNKRVTQHPDTKQDLSHIQIDNWTQLLLLASRCYPMTQLGYIGVDIVLDKHKGPLILELNARPGLSIQLANSSGLLFRLKKVEDFILLNTRELDSKDKVQLAQTWFK